MNIQNINLKVRLKYTNCMGFLVNFREIGRMILLNQTMISQKRLVNIQLKISRISKMNFTGT